MASPRRPSKHLFCLSLLLVACTSCGRLRWSDPDLGTLRDEAQCQQSGEVEVRAHLLSPDECRQWFGTGKAISRGVQPLWLEIDNASDEHLLLLLPELDNHYYAPREAAHVIAGRQEDYAQMCAARAMPIDVPAGQTVSGFVFVTREHVCKYIDVHMLSQDSQHALGFLFGIDTRSLDFRRVDADGLYEETAYRELDLDGLRTTIEALPQTIRDMGDRYDGDPVNLIIVASAPDMLRCFVAAGWDPTEALGLRSSMRSVGAALFGTRYRTMPISPMLLFGRRHDLALQKVRSNIHQRNHLRLWLSPYTHDGLPVWVGQISRDIGSKLTTRAWNLTTHIIDPDVDESRNYLLVDLARTSYLATFAFARGMPPVREEEARRNTVDDPWFSDGLRLVLFIDDRQRGLDELDFLEWERLRAVRPPGDDEPGR